jgi:hypothetical protein
MRVRGGGGGSVTTPTITGRLIAPLTHVAIVRHSPNDEEIGGYSPGAPVEYSSAHANTFHFDCDCLGMVIKQRR